MKINSTRILAAGLLLVIAYLVCDKWLTRKVVFVDTIALVEGYNMKKEQATAMERDFEIKKGRYDSLKTYLLLDTANMQLRRGLFDLEQQLAELEERYQGISVAVWQRINPLLAKFGKEKGYDIIVGANGMGTVLYGKPSIDITREVLDYINKEYEDE